jgi:hypothetical protein
MKKSISGIIADTLRFKNKSYSPIAIVFWYYLIFFASYFIGLGLYSGETIIDLIQYPGLAIYLALALFFPFLLQEPFVQPCGGFFCIPEPSLSSYVITFLLAFIIVTVANIFIIGCTNSIYKAWIKK